MWNEELELSDGSCFVWDIQDYFKYIIKKHEAVSDIPPIRSYVNQIENRVDLESRYYIISSF